jgi:hypothetical protein
MDTVAGVLGRNRSWLGWQAKHILQLHQHLDRHLPKGHPCLDHAQNFKTSNEEKQTINRKENKRCAIYIREIYSPPSGRMASHGKNFQLLSNRWQRRTIFDFGSKIFTVLLKLLIIIKKQNKDM